MFDQTFQYVEEVLQLIPQNVAVAVLMRHADRYKIKPQTHGVDVLLTKKGKKRALDMGYLLGDRVGFIAHSPVERCLQTAKQISKKNNLSPQEWLDLRCDAYLSNYELALSTLSRFKDPSFFDDFVSKMSQSGKNIPYDYFKPPLIAAKELIDKMFSTVKDKFCIAITHDWLVNVTASYATKTVTTKENYAGYLDSLWVWKNNEQTFFYYKGATGVCASNFQLK